MKLYEYFDLPKPAIRRSENKPWPLNLLHVGIEVEAENCRYSENTQYWKETEEGSLANHGKEYITNPLNGEAVLNAIKELPEALGEGHEFSMRCSTHIHVSVLNSSYENIAALMAVWAIIEDGMFGVFAPERKFNNHCVPVVATNLIQEYLKGCLASFTRVSTASNRWRKYTAMNLRPIAHQGTVEFRLFRGSSDEKYLTTAVRTVLTIIKESRKINDIQELIDMVCPSPDAVWERFTGLPYDPSMFSGMLNGARQAQVALLNEVEYDVNIDLHRAFDEALVRGQ